MDSAPPSILPPRPLVVDAPLIAMRRRKTLLLAALLGVFAALALAGVPYFAREPLAARALWQRGTAGSLEDLGGTVEETTKLGIPVAYKYELKVTFSDAAGTLHNGERQFGFLFASAPREEDPGVRYDPANPEQFVLSWEAEGLKPWSYSIGVGAMALLFGWALRQSLRKARTLRALPVLCAEDGEEVLLELVSTWTQNGTHFVKFRTPGNLGRTRQESLDDAPLVVQREGRAWVVALHSRRAQGQYLLVEATLAPFVLPPAEGERVRERLALTAS